VVASSAADVRGDDCAGSLVASRFGDAFFGQMGKTDDLQAAFDAAKKRLAALGAPMPVMTMGAAIAEHLKSLHVHQGRTVASRTRARRTKAALSATTLHHLSLSLSIASARDSG
jgi:hypothetical protein